MTEHTTSIQSFASLGRRSLALLVDVIILFPLVSIGGHLIPVVGGIIVWFFYAPMLESSSLRATLGKYWLGIQVVDSSGRQVSLRAATIRSALKFVSTALLLIGYLFALFNRRRQTLHDLLADTIVVYGRGPGTLSDAWLSNCKLLFRSETSSAPSSSESHRILNELERLQALRAEGALSEKEFEDLKRKLL